MHSVHNSVLIGSKANTASGNPSIQGGCFPSSILRNAAGHIHRNNGHCVKPSGQVTTYTVENQSTAQTVGYKTESSKQYSLSIPGSQDNGHSIRAQPQEMETTSDFTSTSRFLHPVLEVLERRRTAQCTPCSRTDGYKLGLVVEGGGMRGAISGSMLMWLHHQGFGPQVFDAIYGASAGAINACYYVSGQAHGLDIYIDELTQPGAFIDLRLRTLLGLTFGWGRRGSSEASTRDATNNTTSSNSTESSAASSEPERSYSSSGSSSQSLDMGSNGCGAKPVMNLDFLFGPVMHDSKPLDWEAVLQSPTPLKVVASSIDDCGPVTLDSFTSKDHLIEALKAGATVPHIAGPPRIINGKRLLDAAVYEPVPVESAMRDGCTHVMVLCTRPPPVGGPQGALDRIRKHAYGWMEKLAKGVLLGWDHGSGKTPGSAAVLSSSKPSIACPRTRLVHALLGCPHEAAQQHFEGVYVFPVYPATCHGCHPVCLSPDILRMAIQQGRAAMERALGPIMLQPEAATAQLLQQPAAGAAVELLAVAPASAAGVVEDLQSHSTATAMSAPGEHVLQPSVAAASLALYAAATGKAPQAVKQLVLRKHTVADTDRVHSRPAVHAKRSVTVHGGDDLYTIHDQPQQQQQASIFLPTPVYIEVQ